MVEMQLMVPADHGAGFLNVPDGYRFLQCHCCYRRVWLHESYRGFGRWCKTCNDGYDGH